MRVKAVHALDAYANLTIAGCSEQQLQAARVVAAVTDSQVAQLQDLAASLRDAAQTSR